VTSANAVLWLVHVGRMPGPQWTRQAGLLQVTGGLAWATLTAFAMPAEPAWQIYAAAVTLGVQACSALLSSQVREFFYLFHAPHVGLVVISYILVASGPDLWTVGVVSVAGLVTIGLAELHHLTALTASALGVRNAELAAGLELRTQALATMNVRLATQARTDVLTGASNRAGFADSFEKALTELRRDPDFGPVAIAYIDLDEFKQVNDALGHKVGDHLLVAVAGRLTDRLEEDEFLARLGGDEFVVLSTSVGDKEGVVGLGERLQSAFESPFRIDDYLIEAGASIGIADTEVTERPADLLRYADAVLYRAKANGGGRVELFDVDMRRQLTERRRAERDMLSAYEVGEMMPFFQPLVDLTTGRIVAAEALARWVYEGEIRSAGSFIGLATDLGLMGGLTRQIVAKVGDYRLQMASNSVPLTANVAPQHLGSLLDEFGETGLFDGLILEISDQSGFADLDESNELIARVHDRGARIYLDDFGMGLSSLGWALDLDVDGYKIDRSFITRLHEGTHARAVVAGIVEIARQQGREVVAEGVESAEQAAILMDLGVRLAQGFLFSPAVSLGTLDRWLVNDHRFPIGSAVSASAP
jgi:diguanylate cyclase (GGDEF)-like protein